MGTTKPSKPAEFDIDAYRLTITNFAHKTRVIGDSEIAAVVAAIDMAAQRRRSTVLDRRHDLQLGKAEMPGLGETVAGTHGPEDVGDLQRGGPHGLSAARRRRVGRKYPEPVERADHGAHRTSRHLGVEGGGVQLGVTEQRLNDADVDAVLQQMRGEAVAWITGSIWPRFSLGQAKAQNSRR